MVAPANHAGTRGSRVSAFSLDVWETFHDGCAYVRYAPCGTIHILRSTCNCR